jgi:hypothetical protein
MGHGQVAAHGKNRAELVASRATETGRLAKLKVEKVAVECERKAVEADLGPLRYLAKVVREESRFQAGTGTG